MTNQTGPIARFLPSIFAIGHSPFSLGFPTPSRGHPPLYQNPKRKRGAWAGR